jgi:hypothetical protein
MKLILLVLLLSSSIALSKERAIGLLLGIPSAFHYKERIDKRHFWDVAAGSFMSHERLQFHSDYLVEKPYALMWDDQHMDLYYGLGARLSYASEDNDGSPDKFLFGPRLPVGLEYRLDKNWELFGETALIFNFAEEFGTELNLSLGLSYYFE